MKRLLFTCWAAVITSASFGQCTPDPQYTDPGIYPDTITNLPHATVGVAYSATITAVVAPDTTVTDPFPATLTINYFLVDSVVGMPAGFTFSCTPSNCELPGAASSCLELTSADPQMADIGQHPLIVHVSASLTHPQIGPLPLQPGTITGYEIVIENAVGISASNEDVFTLAQNVPNPASESTVIRFTDPIGERVDLSIYNAAGQRVVYQTLAAERGLNEVNISIAELPAGIYLYTVRNSSAVLNKRMVITK